jgi:hypothetical protein
MKRAVFVLLLFLSGCVVQSFGPFCSDQSLVYLKGVTGQWSLQTDYGDDVRTNAIKPWVFSGDTATNCRLMAFDKQNIGATFDVRFFKLGNGIFIDIAPKDLSDEAKVNSYWAWTVHPTHTVCKVELKDDRLTLKPLDYDWLKKNLQQRKVSLPYMGKLDDVALFTASPEQWEAFLSKQSTNTEAFVEEHAFVLKKAAPTKPGSSH